MATMRFTAMEAGIDTLFYSRAKSVLWIILSVPDGSRM